MDPAKPAARKSPLKRAPARRRPRKAKALSRGLAAGECRLDTLGGEANDVKARIENEGGFVLGCYNEPLGKQPVIAAGLPIDAVEPTPFQRDLSQTPHPRPSPVPDPTRTV